MFCKNCGRKLEEGQQFCAGCGTRVNEGQEAQFQNNQTNQFNQMSQGPMNNNMNNSNMNNNNNMMYGSNNNNASHGGNTSNQNTKKLLMGVVVIALIALGIFYGPKLFKGTASSPEAVAKAFFTSVYKEDPDAMLKLVYKDDLQDYKDELDKDYLKDMMKQVNTALKQECGDKWVNDIKYSSATETDSSSDYKVYKVKVTIKGESDYIYVKKVGSKYYLDPTSF